MPLVSVVTRCAVVDKQTRKATSVPSQLSCTRDIAQPLKLTAPQNMPSSAFQMQRKVEPHHLDQNQHLNVRYYVELSMECLEQAFAEGYFQGRDIWLHPINIQTHTLDILFENEAVLHDVVTFRLWLQSTESQSHLHFHLINDQQTVAFLSMQLYNTNTASL